MKLWGGRFSEGLDPEAWQLNASIGFDQRLARQDVRGSQAWAEALKKAGLLSEEEHRQIANGLEAIDSEFEEQRFTFEDSDEDIHTAVERRLQELIGAAAGKLHTGRSRNDQVATDLRLWLLDHLPRLDESMRLLQSALIERAEADLDVVMPGYTHLQRAQPILLSHWWLSHFWPLARDRQRLAELKRRAASLPLGAGALAGTPFPIERHALAQALGFERAAENSIDAVADRDFAAEFLFCAALTGLHLSKLAEGIILFSSAEFGYLELPDAFATGSSLMPQKKNPDIFELTRGKAGTLLGYLSGFMAVLKGLPSAYDKDLQEDKVPLFTAFDTLSLLLPVLAGALRGLTIRAEKMRANIAAEMLATDLADYLVEKGIPFREGHELVSRLVGKAVENGKALDGLSLEEFQEAIPQVEQDVYQVFDVQHSVSRRRAFGGTAPEAVREQIRLAKERMEVRDRNDFIS
jgi:argininosuccinate lyase